MSRLHAWLAVVAVVCLLFPVSLARAGGDSRREVKVSARAISRPDAEGKQMIMVTLAINPGWHVYANPVNNEEFATVQTTVKVSPQARLRAFQARYPVGKIKVDVDAQTKKETRYNVYQGTVEIPTFVQRASGDSAPLEVSVDFMACDDSHCLRPANVKLRVE